MTNGKVDFDVGIIGGGPAGASMAAYLARAGVRCVVLESELFPRPHVGESLVPSSTRVFRELGFLDEMERQRFPHKYGAVWTAAGGNGEYSTDWHGLRAESSVDISFGERQQPGVDQDYTYHVDRGKFDLALLQHAHGLGATVYEGVRVRRVDFDDPQRPRVMFRLGRRDHSLRVRLVVDASGRRTLLGNQLGLRRRDPVFDQFAIHGWWAGFDRARFAVDGKDNYIFIHFLPVTNTWVWQIPITDTVTSFGVVTQREFFKGTRASRRDFFWKSIGSRPELLDGLQAAEQVTPFREEGDYSYSMTQICGDGFLLIGDAARFVDPIFSTGVSIALNSSRFASRDVLAALERGVCDRASFADYEAITRRGMKNWYEFISLYYRLNVLFTAFIHHPDYRLDVLKLLQGDVYDEEEPAVLARMKRIVEVVEKTEDHVWHPLLGDLSAELVRPEF